MNVVRFAPSPTGSVHIGSLRTALYNYLFAKKTGGKYLLRVEDTDQTRFVEGAIEGMLQAMKWAGIDHTEGVMISEDGQVYESGESGPYIQSERPSKESRPHLPVRLSCNRFACLTIGSPV